jgi:phosphatidylserine/phosphatidylglycerophosphate/cardiolipin synthase-like enzyme
VRIFRSILLFSLLSGLGCVQRAELPRGGITSEPIPRDVELVASSPSEVPPSRGDLRDAWEVWPKMIDGAQSTLAIAQLYVSEADRPSRLTPVIEAIERAAARDVEVRLLADGLFATKYPDVLDRLRKRRVTVRTIAAEKHYGGVMHAKYFVVDGRDAFIGSQNFDWRSLEHTYEIGARVRSPEIGRALLEVFDVDWRLAAGEPMQRPAGAPPPAMPGARLVASPKGWLPREDDFELDAIVSMLRAARRDVRVHVLLYSTQMRDKSSFTVLDEALRDAAKRGVHVRLLVSDWSTKPGSHERASLDALSSAGIDMRVVTIPEHSSGPIPFARVVHAKFLVVDEDDVWLGSSNWEGDYFLKTRDVGLVLHGRAPAERLASSFDAWWSSRYAAPIASPAPLAPGAPPSSSGPAPR